MTISHRINAIHAFSTWLRSRFMRVEYCGSIWVAVLCNFPFVSACAGRVFDDETDFYTSLVIRDYVRSLFNGIVRGFAGNHDVVYMALAQAGAADAYETRLLEEFGNGGTAAVSHSGLQSSHHLVDDHCD